ncbi:MAG TPA: SRPBCC family protein [Actinomycetota bacterium]|nr:SRPBCC family protein [Actinomycetota bacterium]
MNFYRFHSEWTVPADFETTFPVLQDLRTYARWWPEVKSVLPVSEDRAVVLIMGVLPYSLEFLMEKEVDDASSGVLRAGLSGDLEGFSSWTVKPENGGCRLVYDQEVEVTKRLLQVLAPVARPFFRLNHRLMMSRGQKGLRAFLASDQP